MRDWKGDLEWYDTHKTTAQIGFNPDGMCLKVCRTSRDIGPRYLTAKECQDAVPKNLRITKPRNLRKGMKLFYDDPTDSNTAGHIVTMVGRVKGFDWDDMNDILVSTNSVKSGQLVVVRGTYFKTHWNDTFQFGAPWINGFELDYPGWRNDGIGKEDPKPVKDMSPRVQNFRESGNKWDLKILDRAIAGGRKDIAPKLKAIEEAVASLPDDAEDSKVAQFKATFEKDRVLDMKLLNEAVDAGRTGDVKKARDDIRVAIKSILKY